MSIPISDKKWLEEALPQFGIKRVGLAWSSSQKKWPDLWVSLNGVPTITVTQEWRRQDTAERRKRLIHELEHIKGREHGRQPGGLLFSTVPKYDTYSKRVYDMMSKESKMRNPVIARTTSQKEAERAFMELQARNIPVKIISAGRHWYISSNKPVIAQKVLVEVGIVRNPKIHPQALESLKRYKGDIKAGHKDAAEYWRGQAGAYFTANPRVSVPECPKCHRKLGERHVATTKRPSFATMEKWMEEGVARATDGCRVEPDGVCPHGHMSWLRTFGYVNPRLKVASFTANPQMSPEVFYYSWMYKEYDHFRLLRDNKVALYDKNNNAIRVVSLAWFRKLQSYEDFRAGRKSTYKWSHLKKNPILETIGASLATGLGFGAGMFGVRKLLKGNPKRRRK